MPATAIKFRPHQRGSAGAARADLVERLVRRLAPTPAPVSAVGVDESVACQAATAVPVRIEAVNVSNSEVTLSFRRDDEFEVGEAKYVIEEDYTRKLAPFERRSLAIMMSCH